MHEALRPLGEVRALRDPVLIAAFTGFTDGHGAATAAVRALISADGVREGHLIKWVGSTAVDGSLAAAIAPLGVLDPASPVARRTIDVLEAHLTVDGGTHRYLGDTFFGGGQWPLLSCHSRSCRQQPRAVHK